LKGANNKLPEHFPIFKEEEPLNAEEQSNKKIR